MIQKILYASDLGVYTPYIFQHVIDLACQYQAKVYVVHAVEPWSYIAGAVVNTYMPTETRQELESNGLEEIIEGIKQTVISSLEIEYLDGDWEWNTYDADSPIQDVRVIPGKPAEVIIQQANKINADLIVLGSHGQDSNNPHMLGSVASKILQMAKVPVYMVPMMRQSLSKAS